MAAQPEWVTPASSPSSARRSREDEVDEEKRSSSSLENSPSINKPTITTTTPRRAAGRPSALAASSLLPPLSPREARGNRSIYCHQAPTPWGPNSNNPSPAILYVKLLSPTQEKQHFSASQQEEEEASVEHGSYQEDDHEDPSAFDPASATPLLLLHPPFHTIPSTTPSSNSSSTISPNTTITTSQDASSHLSYMTVVARPPPAQYPHHPQLQRLLDELQAYNKRKEQEEIQEEEEKKMVTQILSSSSAPVGISDLSRLPITNGLLALCSILLLILCTLVYTKSRPPGVWGGGSYGFRPFQRSAAIAPPVKIVPTKVHVDPIQPIMVPRAPAKPMEHERETSTASPASSLRSVTVLPSTTISTPVTIASTSTGTITTNFKAVTTNDDDDEATNTASNTAHTAESKATITPPESEVQVKAPESTTEPMVSSMSAQEHTSFLYANQALKVERTAASGKDERLVANEENFSSNSVILKERGGALQVHEDDMVRNLYDRAFIQEDMPISEILTTFISEGMRMLRWHTVVQKGVEFVQNFLDRCVQNLVTTSRRNIRRQLLKAAQAREAWAIKHLGWQPSTV